MKTYNVRLTFLILMVLVCFPVCGRQLTVIPEISYSLSNIDVLDLTGKQIVDTIIKQDPGVVLVASNGEISRWNTEEHMKDFLYNLNRSVFPEAFHQDNYLVLREQDPKPGAGTYTYIIFDLSTMKEYAALESAEIKKILGLNRACVLYLSNANEIIARDYQSGTSLSKLKLGKMETVYNGEWKGNTLLILTRTHLYTYDQPRNTMERIKLKHKAASPFLLDGRWIYYGSELRELVKFSLSSRKSLWRFKTGDVLTVQPQKIGPYIAIVPQDNNMYFFNKNGSLYWWKKLDSTLRRTPMAMKENVVVFLWDHSVKFLNYKKKEAIAYPLNRLPVTNPVRIGEYIYVVSEEEITGGKEEGKITFRRLSKIGNHYGVEVKTDPQYVKPLGKSIRFDLQPINLVKPGYSIKIMKTGAGDNPVVFEKQIPVDDKPSFVWVPSKPGGYRLVIDIQAENKKGLTVEQTFEAIDVEQIVRNYYYEIQTRFSLGSLNL
jgi:hypothetical protein